MATSAPLQHDWVTPTSCARARPVPTVAAAARDRALEQVLQHAGEPWAATARRWLREYALIHREFTAEEFRIWAVAGGCPQPHHHNAWGALLCTMRRQGVIEITDRQRPMQTVRSHARRTPVWRSLAIGG